MRQNLNRLSHDMPPPLFRGPTLSNNWNYKGECNATWKTNGDLARHYLICVSTLFTPEQEHLEPYLRRFSVNYAGTRITKLCSVYLQAPYPTAT
jgi:hypothetical protein